MFISLCSNRIYLSINQSIYSCLFFNLYLFVMIFISLSLSLSRAPAAGSLSLSLSPEHLRQGSRQQQSPSPIIHHPDAPTTVPEGGRRLLQPHLPQVTPTTTTLPSHPLGPLNRRNEETKRQERARDLVWVALEAMVGPQLSLDREAFL